MKLSPDQIQKLYNFTRQHYVEYYDLQTELVDHLANSIENQWQENPKISFEEALQKEFKKFGVFGFQDVVEQRQKALNKKYNKLVWEHFKDFFSVPKIIGSVTAVFGLFYVLKHFYFSEILAVLMIGIILIVFSYLFIKNRKIQKRKKETDKVWLYEQIIFGYGTFSSVLTFPIHTYNLIFNKFEKLPNDYVLLAISLFTVSIYLVSYIIVFLIPSKAEDYLAQVYPEYKIT
jgi:hypothetical protein